LLIKLYQFFKPRDLILYSFLPLPVDQNEHVQGQLYIVQGQSVISAIPVSNSLSYPCILQSLSWKR